MEKIKEQHKKLMNVNTRGEYMYSGVISKNLDDLDKVHESRYTLSTLELGNNSN